MKRWLAFALVTTATTFAYAQQPNHVHIDGPRDTVLELDDGDGWRAVCTAPCDNVAILQGASYRITGSSIQPSHAFAVPPQARIKVDAGSRDLHMLGIVLIPLGGVTLVASTALFLSTISQLCSDCVDGLANTTTANWGWGTLAGGVAGLVAGIVLVATTHTQITIGGAPPPWVRVQDPESTKRREPVKTAGMPIFAVSF